MRPRAAGGVGGGSPDHSPRRLGLDRRALRHSADCATRCRHANSLAFTLGGITLASFVLLVITGIYLAQYYDPTQAKAHGSVVYITDNAFAGALIRSLHYWLSTAFVVALVLHMIRTFATASFKGRGKESGSPGSSCS